MPCYDVVPGTLLVLTEALAGCATVLGIASRSKFFEYTQLNINHGT
jgi:hypothetical protein